MKVFIIYEGEFCTNKPREHMAIPTIHLVTKDKEIAKNKLQELYERYKEYNWVEYIEWYCDKFEFNNEYDTYGTVGITEKELD